MILTSSFPRSANDETCGYIREFARNLADEFEVTVLAPDDKSANDDAPLGFNLVRATGFLFPRTLQASSDLNEVVAQGWLTKILLGISLFGFFIRAFTLSLRADVICSHWLLPSGLIGATVARLLNKPHIIVEHSGALHLLRRIRFGSLMARFMISSSHRVMVVSKDLQAKLLALCPSAKGKIEVAAMGVRTVSIKPSDFSEKAVFKDRPRNLLFIGRLVEIKGLHILLNALAGLPDIRLLIAGDGVKRDEFKALAKRLKINATFFGQVGQAEKSRLLAACDVVVIPSLVLADGRTEGLPVVALEALAAGKPLIASRVGGLAEIINDAQNGLLFEAGESAELAEKIKLLLADHKLQQTLAINARQTVVAFAWQVVSKRFEKIIKDALRKHGAAECYPSTRAESR